MKPKSILNIEGLAGIMKVSRQTVHALLREERIAPDYTDNAGLRYWTLSTAQALADQHEQQKILPRRTLRKYGI